MGFNERWRIGRIENRPTGGAFGSIQVELRTARVALNHVGTSKSVVVDPLIYFQALSAVNLAFSNIWPFQTGTSWAVTPRSFQAGWPDHLTVLRSHSTGPQDCPIWDVSLSLLAKQLDLDYSVQG